MDDLELPVGTADSHRRFCDLITASSVGGMGEVDPDGDLTGLDASVTGSDALTGFAALADLDAFSDFAALTGLDDFSAYDAVIDHDHVPLRRCGVSDHQSDLKNIVDSLLDSPPRASLGRIPVSRLMRQVKSKLADSDNLDVCDAVRDDFIRVGRRVLT